MALAGKAILVCVYHSLFNALSKFGADGAAHREKVPAAGMILDDAHAAFSTIRDQFTFRVRRADHAAVYDELVGAFRSDFDAIGRLGTFDDVIGDAESGVLDVPYWAWTEKNEQIRTILRPLQGTADWTLRWPFVRDQLALCHALISADAFAITPILPSTDHIPTFRDCPKRVFSSATIADDSALVRTFGIDSAAAERPVTGRALVGISERMIIAPELTPIPAGEMATAIDAAIRVTTDEAKAGCVVLVPSREAAKEWAGRGTVAEKTEDVAPLVEQLRAGTARGPIILPNRYDGIDLPGNACRLLIVYGLPRGTNEYELYIAAALSSGANLNSTLAQRIEQGMGRAARGPDDYCVVLLLHRSLNAWLARGSNVRFLTSSTRAQLAMGDEVSKQIKSAAELLDTVRKCFSRDRDWVVDAPLGK